MNLLQAGGHVFVGVVNPHDFEVVGLGSGEVFRLFCQSAQPKMALLELLRVVVGSQFSTAFLN